jgi:RimJ/RimL family protein N-acetyltransferase
LTVEPYDDEIMGWHYEPPYDFYDTAADPPEDPTKFLVVRGDDGRVEAFWYFDRPEDGVVEVGIGLRPDLTGRGLGERLMTAELDYARARWRPHTFRLFVTTWNARAIALYERLGFREVGERHVRSFERFGDHVFIRMERPATP